MVFLCNRCDYSLIFASGVLTSLTTEFSSDCWSVKSVHNTEDMTYIIFLGKTKSKSETSDFKSYDKGIVVLNINTKNEKGNSW